MKARSHRVSDRTNFLGTGNDPFECLRCGTRVLPLVTGFRNHCPACLWSRHVDDVPGDRQNACGGLMEPIDLEGSEGAGWFLVHRCVECGAVRRNRTAEKDPRQPDDWDRIIDLSANDR